MNQISKAPNQKYSINLASKCGWRENKLNPRLASINVLSGITSPRRLIIPRYWKIPYTCSIYFFFISLFLVQCHWLLVTPGGGVPLCDLVSGYGNCELFLWKRPACLPLFSFPPPCRILSRLRIDGKTARCHCLNLISMIIIDTLWSTEECTEILCRSCCSLCLEYIWVIRA